MSAITLFTDLWPWRWWGFPWTMCHRGHMSLSSCITSAVISEPSNECKIYGIPNSRNGASSWNAASAALLDISAPTRQTFVRGHWYTIIQRYCVCWCELDCMSVRSTWLQVPKSCDKIDRITAPVLSFLFSLDTAHNAIAISPHSPCYVCIVCNNILGIIDTPYN